MRAVPKRDSEQWPSHYCPHAQKSPICVPRAVIVINYRHRTERRLGARLSWDLRVAGCQAVPG